MLGYNAADTPWLIGDEILTLIANSNPDAPGQHANWISGPAPLAFLYTSLVRRWRTRRTTAGSRSWS